jgi:CRISPR-associated protein Cas2
MRLAITYDISSDNTRNKVYEVLESYGAWKQLSVFEVDVTKTERLEMEEKIKEKIDEGDKVRVYTICDRCEKRIEDLGDSEPEEFSPVV